MKCCFPEPKLISAVQHTRLTRRKPDGIVNDRAINGTKVFDQKSIAFQPNTSVTARNFGLGIELREIDFRKDIRMRIRPANEIIVLLQNERGIQFGGSGHDQLCRGTGSTQCCTRANSCQWLSCTTVRTENIVSSNPPATKTTVNSLNLNCLATELRSRHPITHPTS